ncbi:unnamed protein product [Prorocentrum cordatum]|uniref:Uncharacterized protein n=1 Tax=Prorocentrum cordatum TaxID=2364126 RepID=A0ABN9RKS6_9DINO|nr:unnamed protein product [Polarella glacialis]
MFTGTCYSSRRVCWEGRLATAALVVRVSSVNNILCCLPPGRTACTAHALWYIPDMMVIWFLDYHVSTLTAEEAFYWHQLIFGSVRTGWKCSRTSWMTCRRRSGTIFSPATSFF